MVRRGLGKGLDSIFGTSVAEKDSSQEYGEAGIRPGGTAGNGSMDSAAQTGDPQAEEESRSGEIIQELLGNEESARLDGQVFVKTSLIQPNQKQPRKNFDEEELQELAESIRSFGVIQPLIVKKQGPFYEIVAGERRWRAARMAGMKEVPVIVRELDERTSREVAIIENIQRADLNAVEEARAYQSLIEDYGLKQEEVADRVAKKRSTITNSLRLLKLEPEILARLESGELTQGHARALLGIEDAELRKQIAERCISEKLSVREIENLVKLDKSAKKKKEKESSEEAEELKRLRVIYADLESKLKSSLGTKVSILAKDKNSGKLEIEYYSPEDLDWLFSILHSASRA